MNKNQKKTVIAEFESLFSDSTAAFLVNYQGLTVAEMQALRNSLRQSKASMHVTKARLMKIAAENKASDYSSLDEFKHSFKEQVALVFSHDNQVPGIAKKIVDFAKDHEALQIVSGFFENKCLTQEDVKRLASIPSREVLIAMLLGTMQAPITSFVRLLHQLIARLLYVLKEIEKQKNNA